jgi:hypothetical protein
VLGLAIQILEDLPNEFRPLSDIEDMRAVLDVMEERSSSCDREGCIIDAVATVLAWRTLDAISRPGRRHR